MRPREGQTESSPGSGDLLRKRSKQKASVSDGFGWW